MESSFEKILSEETRQAFRSEYNGDEQNMEKALERLRSLGLSQMQSTMFLCNELNLQLSEADHIVLYSNTWADIKDANVALRNDFFDFLSEINEE